MHNSTIYPPELIKAQKLVYEASKIEIKNIMKEPESEDYGAYTFQINSSNILFRVAKTTPTKAGQFVTLWKRSAQGPIRPYDQADSVDLAMVSVCKDEQRGLFVFPKEILIKHQVFSREGRGGKRAIRVYPPWDHALNAQALKTQKWQGEYFFAYGDDEHRHYEKLKKLFFAPKA